MATKNQNTYLWIGIVVVAIIVLASVFILSNNSKETQFVCSDGSLVSNKDLCPKQDTTQNTETKTEPKILTEKIIIYEESGQIQQSETSAILKQMTASGGGTYNSNLYQGGEIELIFSASSILNYVLMSGTNCVTEGSGTIILKTGSIKDGTVLWSPTNIIPTELCIKLENLNFVDWNNVNPVTYNLVVKETQTKSE